MEFADWTRAFAMIGKHDDDYVVVAVDDLGNLYALLQGETIDDELRTVRLDDQGRISAFVIDSVDAWGQMLSVGNAELAVRLGSPVSYEQSGRVQFVETFENGLQRWVPQLDGLDAAVALDPEYCASGGYSCKMTGGSTADYMARIVYSQGLLPIGKVGLAFAISSAVDFDSFYFVVSAFDGTHVHFIEGKLDGTAPDLAIRDGTPAWPVVGHAVASSGSASKFYFVKIVADLENDIYDVLRFNQQEIDISAYTLYTEGCDDPPHVEIYFTLYSDDGDNDVVYLDDVILTLAEP